MNTYVRDDGMTMQEVSPGQWVSVATKKRYGTAKQEHRIMRFLKSSPVTADECAMYCEEEDNDGKPKINSCAPVLTKFKEDGIVALVGRRPTRNGSSARVHALTDQGQAIFSRIYGH